MREKNQCACETSYPVTTARRPSLLSMGPDMRMRRCGGRGLTGWLGRVLRVRPAFLFLAGGPRLGGWTGTVDLAQPVRLAPLSGTVYISVHPPPPANVVPRGFEGGWDELDCVKKVRGKWMCDASLMTPALPFVPEMDTHRPSEITPAVIAV